MSDEISAYEKMLNDGSAFKHIDMKKIERDQYAEAGRGTEINDGTNVLGDPIKENSKLEEDNTDWSAVDEAMQRRMNSLKSKMNKKSNVNENIEIKKLKKRVAKLEDALILVMETHEKLLG